MLLLGALLYAGQSPVVLHELKPKQIRVTAANIKTTFFIFYNFKLQKY